MDHNGKIRSCPHTAFSLPISSSTGMVLTPARVSVLREETEGSEWQQARQRTGREVRDASAWERWSRAPSLRSEGKKGDFIDEAGCLMVRQARRQLPRRPAAEGGGHPPPSSSVTGFNGSANCGIRGLSSVPSHHCRQMAFIRLLSLVFHLDSCPLLIRETRG